MAEPLPQPGQWLLTNTGEYALNADGDFVLHDPEYLLLEDGTEDVLMLEQGTTDGFLVEAYDCACCDQVTNDDPPLPKCGPCQDGIATTLTLDIGLESVIEDPNWDDFVSYGQSYCDTPCVDFGGEYAVVRTVGCGWHYSEQLCTRSFTTGGGDPGTYTYYFRTDTYVAYDPSSPFFGWVMKTRLTFVNDWTLDQDPTDSVGTYYWWAEYYATLADPCTGHTLTLTKYNEQYGPFADFRSLAFPCRDADESLIEFPATIDLIIP